MKLYIITDSEGWTSTTVYTSHKEAQSYAKSYFTEDCFASVAWFTISQIDTMTRDVTAQYRIYADGSEKTLFDIDAKD